MTRFLFGWELGENFGHMTTFNAVARELVYRGHEVYVALQNLTDAWRFFGPEIHLLQAPSVRNPGPKQSLDSYVDAIESYGFRDSNQLKMLLRAWREIYRLVKPDMVVLNAPPTSLLAARQEHFKLAVMGSGYHYPPKTVPMPPILPNADASGILLREKAMVDVINQAFGDEDHIDNLRDIFEYDFEYLTTFKEMDHYPQRVNGTYCGAQFSLAEGDEIPWPDVEGPRIFAYVRPNSQHFSPVVAALIRLKMSTIIAAPGLDLKQFGLNEPHIHIHSGPIKLGPLRETCSLAISAGGHATMAAMLTGGVPVLALPNHTEQLLFSSAAVQTGAVVIPSLTEQMVIETLIQQALEPKMKRCAEEFASKYHQYDPTQQAKLLADKLTAV